MAKGDSYAASQLFMGLTPKNGYKASKLYCYKPTDGSGDFSWSRNLSSYRLNQSGSLELMGVNVPRIDYTNTCPELLIEEERENLLTYSEQFDNAAWFKFQSSVTANTTQSPNGLLTADSLIENTAFNEHRTFQIVTLTSGYHIISVYAKKNTRSSIRVGFGNSTFGGLNGAQRFAFFDLNNGTILQSISGGVTKIEDAGNGWYRCIVGQNLISGDTGAIDFCITINGTDLFYTGDGTSGVYLWGAQLEKATYKSSYIPTTSATVTRPQDTNNSNIAFTGNGFSYNLRVRLENRGDLSTPDNIFFIEDNTGTPDVYAGCYVLGDNLTFIFFNAFDIQEFSISLADGIHNIGVSLDCTTGDYEIVIDGVSEFSGTLPYSFSAATDYTKVKLGCISGSTDSIGLNRIIGLQVYDSVLSQADLIEYTS